MKVFNVGDKARVRKDLVGGEMYDTCTSYPCCCNATMTLFAGYVVVVCEKNDRTGIMHLRKVEDGFTTEMPFSWSDDMLEPLEEKEKGKQHGFLTVGSIVKIRSDIAKRVDSKNRIWITLDGKKCPSIHVSNEIKESGNKAVVITEVLSRPGHMDGCAYRARFAGLPRKNITGLFDITMFDCLEDWLAAEKGNKHSDDKSKKGFKVGDKVVIKTTVSSGEYIDNITIQYFMFDQAYDSTDPSHPCRRVGTVSKITRFNPDTGNGAFEINFDGENRTFTWPQSAFELYDGNNDKLKPPKKQLPKKKSVASTADYSGYTPKSEFYCYDYLNRPATFCKNAMENITKIEITVMSGDETGCFYGVYNGKPWQYRFDAAESRFASYDDGSYTVEGKENIEKWINWNYDPEKAIYAEYSMERMRAFRKRE
jgi:hypothetical protein